MSILNSESQLWEINKFKRRFISWIRLVIGILTILIFEAYIVSSEEIFSNAFVFSLFLVGWDSFQFEMDFNKIDLGHQNLEPN